MEITDGDEDILVAPPPAHRRLWAAVTTRPAAAALQPSRQCQMTVMADRLRPATVAGMTLLGEHNHGRVAVITGCCNGRHHSRCHNHDTELSTRVPWTRDWSFIKQNCLSWIMMQYVWATMHSFTVCSDTSYHGVAAKRLNNNSYQVILLTMMKSSKVVIRRDWGIL